MPEGEPALPGVSNAHTGEPLSCVECRTRKLKCDKAKPVCARCAKAGAECVYPESRRKPTFRRRNVRELEARLVQVEALLKEVGEKKALEGSSPAEQQPVEKSHPEPSYVPPAEHVLFHSLDYADPDAASGEYAENETLPLQQDNPSAFAAEASNHQPMGDPFNGELMDLGGIFESLPPFEIMEDLNRIYFEKQQYIIPIIHPARYTQAFYSAPHMKPPLCLQYAIWSLASAMEPKYEPYHDIFYRRARQYAESDELKGYGEHFITVAHAQAWSIIGTYEARALMFTRAAMSCSRAVRLIQMMGLHQLDCPQGDSVPTLLPPRDWAELEERRRTFWGIFCIDSHASISTGWPHLIDATEITTHLPATESAFYNEEEEETCSLHDAFNGKTYSTFAGNILVCHVFNRILKHVYHTRVDDQPENYEYGEYWKRHRDIDNMLSSAFMFLPESSRLPENQRNPVAVHTNLNLHASVICLHHSATEKIDAYNLPESAKIASQARLRTSAQEIINIVKLTSHIPKHNTTPLVALSLYCAASVYIYLCKETQAPVNVDNLDFILSAMEAIGREHIITRAFLRQVILDIEHTGIENIVRLPRIARLSRDFVNNISHNIPLLARSRIAQHSGLQPPLPGRLPLGNPIGKVMPAETRCLDTSWTKGTKDNDHPTESESSINTGNKRRRTASTSLDDNLQNQEPLWATSGLQDFMSATPSSTSSYQDGAHTTAPAHPLSNTASHGIAAQQPAHQMNIPHSIETPSVNHRTATARPNVTSQANAPQGHSSIGVSLNGSILGRGGPTTFTTTSRGPSQTKTTKGGMGSWDLAGMCMNSQFNNNNNNDNNEDGQNVAETNAKGDNSSFSFSANDTIHLDWDPLGPIGREPVGRAPVNNPLGDDPGAEEDGFGSMNIS
ncbi:fungal-specific transcription factor domain-containing protein [Biscogniauxia mediterranea]|nr:fungal-specific transcription factor domain-containing protein [Biscogniauxia mediterranea]